MGAEMLDGFHEHVSGVDDITKTQDDIRDDGCKRGEDAEQTQNADKCDKQKTTYDLQDHQTFQLRNSP